MVFIVFLCLLIPVLFTCSMYFLLKKGRILFSLALIQVILFGVLHISIFHNLGHQHYQYSQEPTILDWSQFIGAHVLRAVDVIDFIEEYDIKLQNVRHNSVLSGVCLVVMHWMVDIFLLGAIFKFINKKTGLLKVFSYLSSLIFDIFEIIWLAWANFFILLFGYIIFAALFLKWRWLDTLFLWPIDNILRVLDVGDTFQIFDWKFHNVQPGFVNTGITIMFRIILASIVGEIINTVQMNTFQGFGKNFEVFTARLQDKNCIIRKNAAIKLGELQVKEAIPDLIKVLVKDKDFNVHGIAEKVLNTIDSRWEKSPQAKNTIPDLIKVLVKDKDFNVRGMAENVLNTIDSQWEKSPQAKNTIPDLIKALTDENQYVRWHAAEVLEKIDSNWGNFPQAKNTISHLIKSLKNKNSHWLVREAAASALGILQAKKAIPLLIKSLKNKNSHWLVREAAASALGRLQAKESTPDLAKALKSPEESCRVRFAAEDALNKINPNWRQKYQ